MIWVLFTAKIPGWALTSIAVVLALGIALFLVAMLLARRAHRDALEGLGPVRQLLGRARLGLAVMRSPVRRRKGGVVPVRSGGSASCFAVWSAMRAFHIHTPLAAAGLVLVLINVATIFPLWPGNFGLVQIAIAFPLVNYGVAYARGFAFGIGLQAIEASVGVGVGLDLPRARGPLVRDAEDDRGASEEPQRTRSRSPTLLALASPASLKGVLRRSEPPQRSPAGLRRVAGRRGGRAAGRRRRRRNGRRDPRSALGGTWRNAVVSDPLGRPVPASWLVLDDGTAVVESSQPIGLPLLARSERDPLRATSAGLGELLLATLSGGPAALLVVRRRDRDGRRRRRACARSSVDALRDLPVRVRLRRAQPAARRARRRTCLRAAEGREARGGRGARGAARRSRGARPLPRPARRRARAAGSAPRSPRWAGALVAGAELVLDTIGFDERARGADLVVTGEGTVDATTFEGKAPGAVAAPVRAASACAASSSAALVRDGIDAHALSGRRARAAEDLVQLGEELARASGRALASSSILPRTLSSFAAQMR